jgi:hypothetical protein
MFCTESAGDSAFNDQGLSEVVDFWTELDVANADLPGALREELRLLELAVTDCIAGKPQNKRRAFRLTAEALVLLQKNTDS